MAEGKIKMTPLFGRGKWSGQIHIVKVYYRRKPNDQR